jgi:hypothetical protein
VIVKHAITGQPGGAHLPTRRRVVVGGASSAGVLALAGCDGPYASYRYRLALTVQDGGLKTGSSVVEVAEHYTRNIDSPGLRSNARRGEATLVDLGGGRLLLGLLTGGARWIGQSLPKNPPKTTWTDSPSGMLIEALGLPDSWQRQAAPDCGSLLGRPPFRLSPEQMPNLVTFADASDPTSLAWVDPRDLAATFGPGVTLAAATIEITNDPVTQGLENRLPWLRANRQYIDPRPLGPQTVGYYRTDFIREGRW